MNINGFIQIICRNRDHLVFLKLSMHCPNKCSPIEIMLKEFVYTLSGMQYIYAQCLCSFKSWSKCIIVYSQVQCLIAPYPRICHLLIHCPKYKLISPSKPSLSQLERILYTTVYVWPLSTYIIHICHRNQTYSVAYAPTMTSSVFEAEIQIIFGTVLPTSRACRTLLSIFRFKENGFMFALRNKNIFSQICYLFYNIKLNLGKIFQDQKGLFQFYSFEFDVQVQKP